MKILFVATLVLHSNTAFAQSDSCDEMAAKADIGASKMSPPANKVVVGQGRLHFHTAPATSCQSKDVFVIPGDLLKVTAESLGWYAVSYTNPKSGKVFNGWLKSERLEPVVQQTKVVAKWCEEITVSGTLEKRTGIHPFNGSKFPVHVLRLQQPLELLAPNKPCEDGEERITVKELQLINPEATYVNKLITVTGMPVIPWTAYHLHTLLDVLRIKEAGL